MKNWEHMKSKDRHQVLVRKGGVKVENIDTKKINSIIEDVCYWRKANQIHKWFVDNVQGGNDDCKEYYVDTEQLTELLKMIKKVIKASVLVNGKVSNGQSLKDGKWVDDFIDGQVIKNPKVAQKLLPTGSGFFFGNEDYDSYYLEKLKDTEKELEEALAKGGGDYYYQSSW